MSAWLVALAGWAAAYGVSWRWLILRGQLRRAELHCAEVDRERKRLLAMVNVLPMGRAAAGALREELQRMRSERHDKN